MCCAWHRALAVHRLDELVSPTPDGEYTGRAVVKLIFNIGKVRPGHQRWKDKDKDQGVPRRAGKRKRGYIFFSIFFIIVSVARPTNLAHILHYD